MGGPLIRDRLFVYGLYQANQIEWETANVQSRFYSQAENTDPFYGLKLDGYITSSQRLSLTAFDTTNRSISRRYRFDGVKRGDYVATEVTETGGRNWVLNYSGRVNDCTIRPSRRKIASSSSPSATSRSCVARTMTMPLSRRPLKRSTSADVEA